MNNTTPLKIIITGGGTAGHINPALAIGQEFRTRYPECKILFIGAKGKLEMDLIPKAGFEIIGLHVAGLKRKLTLRNLVVPFLLYKSYQKARKIVKEFSPDLVIGVGGYASFPTVLAAHSLKIPTLLQEQNSYAGLTNKILARKTQKICVAYPNMDKYFPSKKIEFTGNPVRQDLLNLHAKKEEALRYFDLKNNLPVVLITGGSLGALTLNLSVLHYIEDIYNYNFQLLWQVGSFYHRFVMERTASFSDSQIKIHKFIDRMDLAYSAADLVVARAGACTISELCVTGKAVILIPSPNVAEDHQTRNAMAIVNDKAAVLLPDEMAVSKLIPKIIELLADKNRLAELSNSIKKKAIYNATQKIVDIAETLIKDKKSYD